jgi:hypothetical protein
LSAKYEVEFFPVKRRIADTGDPAADLPDFSADWKLIEANVSHAEIEARFYYEFARESETILCLTERLSQERQPLEPLFYFCFRCFTIVQALVPGDVLGSRATRRLLNLREIGWNALKPQQREAIISVFSPKRVAFREFGEQQPFSFNPAENHGLVFDERQGFPLCLWSGSSCLQWDGIECLPVVIDWSQGSQAVEAAIKKWFRRHKQDLLQLKSEGKLPVEGERFHLRDETGASHPRKKYLTALRGLGAMRLLSRHTLLQAVHITKGYGRKGDSLYYGFLLDNGQPAGRSAWNKGIENARRTFQELFYPRDEELLRRRLLYGLREIEEPISYQRYCSRTGKNK